MSQDHKKQAGTRYAVSPCYQVAFVDANTVFLMDEHGYIALQGRGIVAVLQGLQQAPCTIEAVVEQVADVLSADEARAHLARLIDDGYVLERHDDLDSREVAYWHGQGVDPRQAADQLRQARVALHVFGSVDISVLVQRLHQMDLTVINQETHTPADLALVSTDDYLREDVQVFTRQAWAAGQPCMLLKPVGATPWLGPVIAPGRTACAACLAAQLLMNRRAETFLRQTQGRTAPLITSVARLPGTVELVLGLAALEVTQWLARDDHDRLENTFLTFDLPELKLERHHVSHLPRCPVCGLRGAESPRTAALQKDRYYRQRSPHADAGSRVR